MKVFKNMQTFLGYVCKNFSKYDRRIVISKRDLDAHKYMGKYIAAN